MRFRFLIVTAALALLGCASPAETPDQTAAARAGWVEVTQDAALPPHTRSQHAENWLPPVDALSSPPWGLDDFLGGKRLIATFCSRISG